MELEEGQNPHNRPDIICQTFEGKQLELFKDIDDGIFGDVNRKSPFY